MTDKDQEVEQEMQEIEDEIKEEIQEVKEVQLSDIEQKAKRNGWRPKDQWSGDPDEWNNAKTFNERGDMIGKLRAVDKRMDEQESKFNSRLDHQAKLHEAQMKVTIKDLESRRDDAIDEADRVKANEYQSQIDAARTQPEPQVEKQQSEGQQILDEWNSRNSWIFDEDDARSAYAIKRYQVHARTIKDTSEALRMMESDVERTYPKVNERRNEAQTVEGGRSKPGSRPSTKLTWDRLTSEELKWYNIMPEGWPKKEDYLQAVTDQRASK